MYQKLLSTMAFLNKLFSIKTRKTDVDTSSTSNEDFKVKKDQVRIVLFKEHFWQERQMMFDSSTLMKIPIDQFQLNNSSNENLSSQNSSCPKFSTVVEDPQDDSFINLLKAKYRKISLDNSTATKHCENSNAKRKISVKTCKKDGVVEVTNNFVYQVIRSNSDTQVLGEIIFGNMALSSRSSTVKVHILKSDYNDIKSTKDRDLYSSCKSKNIKKDAGYPKYLMVTHIFSIPVRYNSISSQKASRRTSTCASSSTSDKLLSKNSGPLDILEIDSGLSSCSSVQKLSSPLLESLEKHCVTAKPNISEIMSTTPSSNVFLTVNSRKSSSTSSVRSSAKNSGSFGSDYWDNGTRPFSASDLDYRKTSSIYTEDEYSIATKRTKFGLSIIIELNEKNSSEMLLSLTSYMPLLNGMMCRLRDCTYRAIVFKHLFNSIMLDGCIEAFNWLNDTIFCSKVSHHESSLWWSYQKKVLESKENCKDFCLSKFEKFLGKKVASDASKTKVYFFSELTNNDFNPNGFVKNFCELLATTNVKNTKFFFSSLLTAILTNHLGWISTITDNNSEKMDKDPLVTQLLEVYGVTGNSTKISHVVLYGNNQINKMKQLLVTLSFFIRYSEVVFTKRIESSKITSSKKLQTDTKMEKLSNPISNNFSNNTTDNFHENSQKFNGELKKHCDAEKKIAFIPQNLRSSGLKRTKSFMTSAQESNISNLHTKINSYSNGMVGNLQSNPNMHEISSKIHASKTVFDERNAVSILQSHNEDPKEAIHRQKNFKESNNCNLKKIGINFDSNFNRTIDNFVSIQNIPVNSSSIGANKTYFEEKNTFCNSKSPSCDSKKEVNRKIGIIESNIFNSPTKINPEANGTVSNSRLNKCFPKISSSSQANKTVIDEKNAIGNSKSHNDEAVNRQTSLKSLITSDCNEYSNINNTEVNINQTNSTFQSSESICCASKVEQIDSESHSAKEKCFDTKCDNTSCFNSRDKVIFTLGEDERLVDLNRLPNTDRNFKKSGDANVCSSLENVNREESNSIESAASTSHNYRSQSMPPLSDSKRCHRHRKLKGTATAAVKFDFELHKQIFANYMKSKNLELHWNSALDKAKDIESLPALYDLKLTEDPEYCVDCDTSAGASTSSVVLQTPSNASELAFSSDLLLNDNSQNEAKLSNSNSTSSIQNDEPSSPDNKHLDNSITVNIRNENNQISKKITFPSDGQKINSLDIISGTDETKIVTSSPLSIKRNYCRQYLPIQEGPTSSFEENDGCKLQIENSKVQKGEIFEEKLHEIKSSFDADCNTTHSSATQNLTYTEVPLLNSTIDQRSQVIRNYSEALVHSLVISNRYIPGAVLQGITEPISAWGCALKRDLMLAASCHPFNQSVFEAFCVVADIDLWDVQLVSVNAPKTGFNKTKTDANIDGTAVLSSQIISDMLDVLVLLWKSKASAEHCLQFIENKLKEIYVLSLALSKFLLKTDFCDINTLTSTLKVHSTDVPLLLSVASTHTPEITQKYGVIFR